jgi:hypothetical protein
VKITLEEDGGHFTPPPAVISTDKLSDTEQAHLKQLLQAAERADLAKPKDPIAGGDRISYTITVERNGEQQVLRSMDGIMPQPYADLKNWIKAKERAKR